MTTTTGNAGETDWLMTSASGEQRWEPRIWTVAQTLLVAIMLWMGSTLLDVRESLARLEERIAQVLASAQVMQAAQSERDRLQEDRLNAISNSVQDVRMRVERLERTR